MSQLTQNFYENVVRICQAEKEVELLTYLTSDGSKLLREILRTDGQNSINEIEGRDFAVLLINLIEICFKHITNDDARQSLSEFSSIETILGATDRENFIEETNGTIFETTELILATIVQFSKVRTNLESSNKIQLEIVSKLFEKRLPSLKDEEKIIWIYQKMIRTGLKIFREIFSFSISDFCRIFVENPFKIWLNEFGGEFDVEKCSRFFRQLSFDFVSFISILIEEILDESKKNQQKNSTEIFRIFRISLSEIFGSILTKFDIDDEIRQRRKTFVERECRILSKLKNFRFDQNQKKIFRRSKIEFWSRNCEASTRFHLHQANLEISGRDTTKKSGEICAIGAIFSRILKILGEEINENRFDFDLIRTIFSCLTKNGCCSCFPLSNYQNFLSKVERIETENFSRNEIEERTNFLIRRAFLLRKICSRRNFQENSNSDEFWSFIVENFVKKRSKFGEKFIENLVELFQFCSNEEKENSVKFFFVPTLEYFVSTRDNRTKLVEFVIEALSNVVFEGQINFELNSFSKILIELCEVFPSILLRILPIFGCLISSNVEVFAAKIPENLVQFVLRLKKIFSTNDEATENFCRLLIILIQKSSSFRKAFYSRLGHLTLKAKFDETIRSSTSVQSSVIGALLVSISFFDRPNDENFNFKIFLDELDAFGRSENSNRSWFELIVRLSLSQKYKENRTCWKNSTNQKIFQNEKFDDESTEKQNEQNEEFYSADVESLSDESTRKTGEKPNSMRYGNLIVFPELISIGMKNLWEKVDRQWTQSESNNSSNENITNLLVYLESLCSLVRANLYNRIVLKKFYFDEILFNCLLVVIRRPKFDQKETITNLIITLLQHLWSLSITVDQLEQFFKFFLTNRSLIGPFLRLFKQLVDQIDPNQPQSFCSQPLTSFSGSNKLGQIQLNLEQILSLKEPIDDGKIPQFYKPNQISLVNKSLKNVSFQFPLTVAVWLRINFPFEKCPIDDENEKNSFQRKNSSRIFLHVLTIGNEIEQFEFWVNENGKYFLRIGPTNDSTRKSLDLVDLPRQIWSQIVVEFCKISNEINVFFNGKKSKVLKNIFENSTLNSGKNWSISLGHQSVENVVHFHYDLGNILFFSKIDFREKYFAAFLFGLGPDLWNFFTANHQRAQRSSDNWIFQRMARVSNSISFEKFLDEKFQWENIFRRSIVGSFSTKNPWTFFVFNSTSELGNEISISRIPKFFPFFSNSPNVSNLEENFHCSTVEIDLPSKISVDQSSNVLNILSKIGSIFNLIFLFGKIVEFEVFDASSSIENLIEIIFSSIWKMKNLYELFFSLDGYRLLAKIFSSKQFEKHLNKNIFQIFIEKSTTNNNQKIFDLEIFRFFLLDWKIWKNQRQIYEKIIFSFNNFLAERNNGKYFFVNRQIFKRRLEFSKIFFLIQEIVEDEQTKTILNENVSNCLIEIIENLLENEFEQIERLVFFILTIHPLMKTYVVYHHDQFYFVDRTTKFCQKSTREKNLSVSSETKQILANENLQFRRSQSVVLPKNSTKNSENKRELHSIENLSTGLLRILTNFSIVAADRLFHFLIEKSVFNFELFSVLLLDSSNEKRIQTLKLIDVVLKRLNNEKVNDLIQSDVHIILANQIYQIDETDDFHPFIEVCLSIALQRPVKLDFKQSFHSQIESDEDYFSIVSSSTVCPRSQIGLTLLLSLIEKSENELLLEILNEIIQRSHKENIDFLINVNLIPVLFNTVSFLISQDNEKLLFFIEKCLNTLITSIWNSNETTEICFHSIMNAIVGTISKEKSDVEEESLTKKYRRVVHHLVCSMFITIIDLIEKPPENKISLKKKSNNDEMNKSSTLNELCERFQRFIQLSIDYIVIFNDDPIVVEQLTIRLLGLCLLGTAYSIEKRPTSGNHRQQWSLVLVKLSEFIKQTAQKLLVIALEPSKQRFFFRIEILKELLEQANIKAILEFLFSAESIYAQILIYLTILFKTRPTRNDIEQWQQTNPLEISNKSFDSGNISLNFALRNKSPVVSNGEESSSNTVHIDGIIRTNSSNGSTRNFSVVSSRNPEEIFVSDDEIKSNLKFQSLTNENDDDFGATNDNSTEMILSSSPSISSISNDFSGFNVVGSISNYSNSMKNFQKLLQTLKISPISPVDVQTSQSRELVEFIFLTNFTQNMTKENFPKKFSQNSIWSKNVEPNEKENSTNEQSQITNGRPTWEMIVESKRQEFAKILRQEISSTEKQYGNSKKSLDEIFTKKVLTMIRDRAIQMTQNVVNLQGKIRKEFHDHLRLIHSDDVRVKKLWHQLIDKLTHENGIWFDPTSYPKFWELDPTENPHRERRRLQRSYCFMEKRFFQEQIPQETVIDPPLSYLFDNRQQQFMNISNVLAENEKLLHSCLCFNVTPNYEIRGEFIFGSKNFYFVSEEQFSTLTSTQITSSIASIGYSPHAFTDNLNSFSFPVQEIYEIHKRRYTLKDVAIELFLTNGVTRMIVLSKTRDRDNLFTLIIKHCSLPNTSDNKLQQIQTAWRHGPMTNFDYLMQLNTLAGRTYLDLMQYPVYPYVVASYDGDILDLRQPSTYRNLAKPIAIQHPEKEEKFVETYRALHDSYQIALALEQNSDSPSGSILPFGHQSKPYHFASLYSNSGVVLHFLVRMLPYTRMFLDYQDNNFDCADRTFHDVKTSYWLSSYESTSDFKEIIPEFFYLHEFLLNKQGFNFGSRQNGERVSDVSLPAWSKKDARLYVYALRQALESEYVTTHLHQWIDLIFGYKQTDKPALDAVNVYHAACYYGFPIEDFEDQLAQNAYQGIVRTYGQVPIKLFNQPHPNVSSSNPSFSVGLNGISYDRRSMERPKLEATLPKESIHCQIIGVRWGDFIGSYDMPSPEYVSCSERSIQVTSFAISNNGGCIIGLPASTMIIQTDDGTYDSLRRFGSFEYTYSLTSSSTSQSSLVNSALESMVALKWNTTDGIIRCRSLKQPKAWHNLLVPVDDQDKITFCTSIDCRLLFIGKASGLIEIYGIQKNRILPEGIELLDRYLPFIAHRSSITFLYVNRQFSLLLGASADGMLTLWDTNRLSYVRAFNQDNHSIYYLTSSETSGDIAYLSSSGSQWHLTYLTCNCDLVRFLTFTDQLNCLCFTSANEGTCVNLLVGGFSSGLISMWSTWDLTLLRQLNFSQITTKPIIALCISKTDRRRLLVADGDRRVHTVESRLSSSSNIQTTAQFLFLT